jgi:hypothetical protein
METKLFVQVDTCLHTAKKVVQVKTDIKDDWFCCHNDNAYDDEKDVEMYEQYKFQKIAAGEVNFINPYLSNLWKQAMHG